MAFMSPILAVAAADGDAQGDGPAGDVYAKVVDESSGATPGVIVRFTSMTPEVRRYLANRA